LFAQGTEYSLGHFGDQLGPVFAARRSSPGRLRGALRFTGVGNYSYLIDYQWHNY
jgi:hypothetical protein